MGSRRWDPIYVEKAATVAELAEGVSHAAFGADRPAPKNLDGLVDVVREVGVGQIVVKQMLLEPYDEQRVSSALRDVGVGLYR